MPTRVEETHVGVEEIEMHSSHVEIGNQSLSYRSEKLSDDRIGAIASLRRRKNSTGQRNLGVAHQGNPRSALHLQKLAVRQSERVEFLEQSRLGEKSGSADPVDGRRAREIRAVQHIRQEQLSRVDERDVLGHNVPQQEPIVLRRNQGQVASIFG